MRRWLILPWLLCLTTLSMAQGGLYDIPQPFTESASESSTIALTRAGRVISTQPLTHTVSVIGLDGTLEAEFDLQRARGVTILPDNRRALAVGDNQLLQINLSDNTAQTLSAAAGGAYVVARDDVAYVSQPDSSQVLQINLNNPSQISVIPTPPQPAGLALWGNFLYVTHVRSGQFSLIYTPTGEVVRTIQPTAGATLAEAIALDTIDGLAYLPLSRANPSAIRTDNRFVPLVAVVDLRTLQTTRLINLIVADRYVSYPVAAALNQNRTQLAIAHAGSDSVTVLDIEEGIAAAHMATDGAPHGIAYNRGYTRLYTSSRIESSVMVHDTRFFAIEDIIPATEKLAVPGLVAGAQTYYRADRTVSCVSCHLQGAGDGREWFGSVTPALSAPYDVDALRAHIAQVQPNRPPLDAIAIQSLIQYLQTLNDG
jgi:DNA-binding beta-propeller fold protein YncE